MFQQVVSEVWRIGTTESDSIIRARYRHKKTRCQDRHPNQRVTQNDS